MNSETIATYLETPIRIIASQYKERQFSELQYVEHLQEQLAVIATSINKDKEENMRKMEDKEKQYLSRIQEQQSMVQSLLSRNQQLQSENSSLKLTLSQSERYLKRYEMKLQLLTNKITHLSKVISQKEAIIKYLEDKSDINQRYNHKISSNDSFMQYEDKSSFRINDISFGKLKMTNPLTFETFTQPNLKNTPKDSTFAAQFRPRDKRVRTEANETKENRHNENVKNGSHQKLRQMLGNKQWNNQQTLSKNRNMSTTSFWKQASFKGGQTLNKSINANSTTFFRDLQFDRDLHFNESYSKP